VAVIVIINHYHRRQKARTQTRYRFKSESHIFGSLPFFNTELMLYSLYDLPASFYMTGGSPATPDGVATSRFEMKLLVKCSHAVYLVGVKTRFFTYFRQDFRRKITVNILNLLEDWDKTVRGDRPHRLANLQGSSFVQWDFLVALHVLTPKNSSDSMNYFG